MSLYIDMFLADGRLKQIKRQPTVCQGTESLTLKDDKGNTVNLYLDTESLRQLQHVLRLPLVQAESVLVKG